MQEMVLEESRELRAQNARLREEVSRFRGENARLREENRQLRAAITAHVTRARCAAAYGPLELTAGTSVGPHRARTAHRQRDGQ